jgi:hypothetical protein
MPIKDEIEANAKGPKSASGDEGSITQHSLQDQIAADKYLAEKAAAKKGIGIRIFKMKAGGPE